MQAGTDSDATRGRMDRLRAELAATEDPAGRARLRVRLAEVMAAGGDLEAAASELKRAAVDAPPSAGLLLSAGAVVARLPAAAAAELREAIATARPARPAAAAA